MASAQNGGLHRLLGLHGRQSRFPAQTSGRRTGQQRGLQQLWEPGDGTTRHRQQLHQHQYQHQQQPQRVHRQPKKLYNPNEMSRHQQHPYQQRMPVRPGIIHRSGQEQSMVTKKPALTPQVQRRTDLSELSITDLWNASRKTIKDVEERVKEVYSQSDIRWIETLAKHFRK